MVMADVAHTTGRRCRFRRRSRSSLLACAPTALALLALLAFLISLLSHSAVASSRSLSQMAALPSTIPEDTPIRPPGLVMRWLYRARRFLSNPFGSPDVPTIPGFGTPFDIAMAEKAALLEFAAAFNNHPAFKWGGWYNVSLGMTYETSRPCVQFWKFITCNDLGRVNGINMQNSELAGININWGTGGDPGPLKGEVPWAKLTALEYLGELKLTGNLVKGTMPEAVGYFTRMENIWLDFNMLTGTIPQNLTRLTILRELFLSNNKITGKLPTAMGNLRALSKLNLYSNQISDVWPADLGRATNLTLIDIGINGFYGALPESWGNLTNLVRINLQATSVNGSLPQTWSKMQSLKQFRMSECSLQSMYPTVLLTLKNLTDIEVFGNRMYGELPKNLWAPPKLTKIELHKNFFNGSVVEPPYSRDATFKYFGNCLNATKAQNADGAQLSASQCTKFYNSLLPPAPPTVINQTVPAPPSSSGVSTTVLIIAIVVPGIVLIALIAFIIYYVRSRRGRRISKLFTKGLRQTSREFTLSELKSATNNWGTAIGKGGYGTVYKAVLKDGTAVAVKRLDQVSKQGDVEFIREVELLSRVHHRHLVNLIGFCAERGERALVYEYMAMGSLYEHLHGDSGKQYPLSWDSRCKIAIHVALGIEYLHYGADPPLIHRDIKSANILLSDDGYSKVADFGLCKEAPVGAGSDGSEQLVPTATAVRGSFGYLDPEYVNTSVLSEKSDVYSYGVVLLELITGHKSIHEWQPLAYWAEEYLADREKTPLMVDPVLEGNFDHDELFALCDIARTCVQDQSANRPTIRDVAKALVENLGSGMTSFSGSQRDSASVITSSQSDATSSVPSTSYPASSAPESSEFSYQNYSETLHWTPSASGEVSASKSGGNVTVSRGAGGDRLPVPVPKRPDQEPPKE